MSAVPQRPLPTEVPAIEPGQLEAAVVRFETWLAFADVNRPGVDHIHQVSYERFPIGDADLRLLIADYRHHRPTQWAYDRACEALHARPTHAEHERALAEVERLTAELTDEIEWGIGHPEGDGQVWYENGYTPRGAVHHAKERGNGRFPAWRRLARWHNATEEQP